MEERKHRERERPDHDRSATTTLKSRICETCGMNYNRKSALLFNDNL